MSDGSVLKNLRINANAADGIHCAGNCTLENVVWEDVCEDAATMHGGAGKTLSIVGGSANNAEDKVFQHNGVGGTVKLRNFNTYGSIGKLWQSCGNCSNNAGPRYLDLDGVNINGSVSSYLLRLNYNYNDKATVRNLRIKGYSAGKPKVCVQAIGVQPGQPQTNNGEFWETQWCDIRRSDVTGF